LTLLKECTNIFSSEGGRLLAEELKLPFIGKIPIDTGLTTCCETGESFVEKFPDSPSISAISKFVDDIVERGDKIQSD
jgi:hypothetical protein